MVTLTITQQARILTEVGLSLFVRYADHWEFWDYLTPFTIRNVTDKERFLYRFARNRPEDELIHLNADDLEPVIEAHGIYPYGKRMTPSLYRIAEIVPDLEEFVAVCSVSTIYTCPTQQVGGRSSGHYRDIVQVDDVMLLNDIVMPHNIFKQSYEWWTFPFAVERPLAERVAKHYGGIIDEDPYTPGRYGVEIRGEQPFHTCIRYAHDRLFGKCWPGLTMNTDD